MTKPEGRTFYGKYGLLSPRFAPAYKAAAAELQPEAMDMIHRITTFKGDETAKSQLYDELTKFYARVRTKIEEHANLKEEDLIQKNPTKFQSISIVTADGTPVEAGMKPSMINIIAFTHSGGSRKRKKRKRTKRYIVDFSKRYIKSASHA